MTSCPITLTWPQEAFLSSILRELRDEGELDGRERALAQRILSKLDAAEVAAMPARALALIAAPPSRQLPEHTV